VPELVPIRYGRMLVSPFTFYRGAAMIRGLTVPLILPLARLTGERQPDTIFEDLRRLVRGYRSTLEFDRHAARGVRLRGR
jgi:hypothetical protein